MDFSNEPRPFPLMNDGDLLLFIMDMLNKRSLSTIRITKFKGHADDDMVNL